jgi:carbonic anhydrase
VNSPPKIAAVDTFKDLVDGNSAYASNFPNASLSPIPQQHLAVVTCMDCRIDPLAIFGFEAGDIHVMRNAGARITPDMLRSLIKSVNQLEVDRIAIVHHTDCGAAKIDLPGLRAKVLATTGSDPSEVEFHLIGDQAAALDADIEAVRTCPYLPVGTAVAGFLYDVTTGIAHPHDSTFVG